MYSIYLCGFPPYESFTFLSIRKWVSFPLCVLQPGWVHILDNEIGDWFPELLLHERCPWSLSSLTALPTPLRWGHSAICQEPFFLGEASKQWTPRLCFMNNVHVAVASGYWSLPFPCPLISMIWVWRGLLSLAFSFPYRLWLQCSASDFLFLLEVLPPFCSLCLPNGSILKG